MIGGLAWVAANKRIAILIIAAILVGLLVKWLIGVGAGIERTKTEIQNGSAVHEADTANLDYVDCIDAGRMFDFATGKCGGSF